MRGCILTLLALTLLIPTAAAAKGTTLQAEQVDRKGVPFALPLEYNTICVDGYKYLFVFHARASSEYLFSGLTQMFEERNGESVPARCSTR